MRQARKRTFREASTGGSTLRNFIVRSATFLVSAALVLLVLLLAPLDDVLTVGNRGAWVGWTVLAMVLSSVVLLAYSDWAVQRGIRMPGTPRAQSGVPLPHPDNSHDYGLFAKS